MFSLELKNFESSKIFEDNLYNLIKSYEYPPIFLCIGTSKCLQDCFGSLCGTALKKQSNFLVFGSLKHEITARNFLKSYQFIKKNNTNNPIVIIDNVLIKNSFNTKAILKNGGVCPNGIFSDICIGDISILVNGFSYNKFTTINNYKNIYKIILNTIKKLKYCFE